MKIKIFFNKCLVHLFSVNNLHKYLWFLIFSGRKHFRKKLNNKKRIQADSAPAATGASGLAALPDCCCCWALPAVGCNPCSSATPWKSFPGKPWSKSYETGVGGRAPVWAWGDWSTAITRRSSSSALPSQEILFYFFSIRMKNTHINFEKSNKFFWFFNILKRCIVNSVNACSTFHVKK